MGVSWSNLSAFICAHYTEVYKTMLIEITLGLVFSSILWYLMTRLPSNYPPTPPTRLPILGHAHYLFWITDGERTSALCKMFKRYSKNDMLTLHIGTERITMIGKDIVYKNSPQII